MKPITADIDLVAAGQHGGHLLTATDRKTRPCRNQVKPRCITLT